MPFKELAKGAMCRILFWAATQEEAELAEKNCPDITERELAKLPRLYKPFADNGEMPKSSEKFKSVEDEKDLFAFKSHQVRLLGAFLDRVTFGICHCVRKKRQKYRPADLETAQKKKNSMKKEWESEHP